MKTKLTLIALASFALSMNQYVFAQEQSEEKGQLVSVEYAKSEQVSPTMWVPGNVISRRNSQLSAEQTGQLLWVEEVGSQVDKGQVIAKLDNRHLKLTLGQQQAQLKQHQADVTYLTKQKVRISKLSKMNNTALSELERTTKDLAVAESEVAGTQLAIAQTELAIDKTEIKAPFSGSISERFVDEGELIAQGGAVVQLVDTSHLDIKVSAPLNVAPYLTKADKIMVKWQSQLFELPIRTWSAAGDQLSRSFDVRLKADGLNLMTGSAVTVSLPKSETQVATLVPRDALVLREKETFVLKINDENFAQKVNVLVGQGIGKWVSVSGRIDAGDEVIIRGGERLQLEQKIRRDNVNATEIASIN